MNIDGMAGPDFWHQELPKEIDRILGGVPQHLDLPEEFEIQDPISMLLMREVLRELVEDYRADLSGIEVYAVRVVDGQQKGVARRFEADFLLEDIDRCVEVKNVARILVRMASFYAPDYGKVDHPCHQWCKDWGKCDDIQKPALTSLIQHFCNAYGAVAQA